MCISAAPQVPRHHERYGERQAQPSSASCDLARSVGLRNGHDLRGLASACSPVALSAERRASVVCFAVAIQQLESRSEFGVDRVWRITHQVQPAAPRRAIGREACDDDVASGRTARRT